MTPMKQQSPLSDAIPPPHVGGSSSAIGIRVHTRLPLTPDTSIQSCLLELDDQPIDIRDFAAVGMSVPDVIARGEPGRQAAFFHGRWAARAALREAIGVGSDVGIGSCGEPVWPAGIVGSLTHCRGYAAAAVARTPALQALGIDIARVATGEPLHTLRSTTLEEEELQLLHAREPAWPAAVLITLAASAKQSLAKAACASAGRWIGPRELRVAAMSPTTHELTLEFLEDRGVDLRAEARVTVRYYLLRPDVVFTAVSW